ncbi:hypothetical protein BH09MYX1_BH09MYX1_06630 [soil metagenome]
MGMFDSLLDADDAVVDFLIHAQPTNDAETAQMVELFALRTSLDRAINGLVAHRLALASVALAEDAKALEASTASLRTVAQTIDQIQTVVRIGGTVLEIATKALAFVS